jgi:hypothetical protein
MRGGCARERLGAPARGCTGYTLLLTLSGTTPQSRRIMKKNQVGITKRLAAAALVAGAVVGVSALAMHTSTHNQNALARPLKSIQTDKAILFDGSTTPLIAPNVTTKVAVPPPITGESKVETENLKLVAQAF